MFKIFKNYSVSIGDVFVIVFSFLISISLFRFGLTFPLESRLTGDAREYMEIASSFKSFIGAVTFIGERTLGMPLFDWIFHFNHSSQGNWMKSICLALFIIHSFSCVFFVYIVYKSTLIKSRNGLRFLFFFILTFPAFIGHTTTPLTDTLAVDLSFLILLLLIKCGKGRNSNFIQILF